MEETLIRIITDSTSDITLERMKELNIDVLPLMVRFGEETYETLYEITNEEFFDKMAKSEEMPSTMQVNPNQFEEVFKKYIEAGDEIIGIMLGAKLSGTYQSAVIAANEFDADRITIIDTKNISVGEALLVQEAVRLRNEGKTSEEIIRYIKEMVNRTRTYLILENLDFLRHGGRISPEEYVAGENLGIRPVIQVEETVKVVDKVKGVKGTNRFILNRLQEFQVEKDSKIYLCHGNAPELAESIESMLHNNGYNNEVITCCIGPIVGAHMGANCVGIGFVGEK